MKISRHSGPLPAPVRSRRLPHADGWTAAATADARLSADVAVLLTSRQSRPERPAGLALDMPATVDREEKGTSKTEGVGRGRSPAPGARRTRAY